MSACTESNNFTYSDLGWEDLRPYKEDPEDQKQYVGSLEIVNDLYSNDSYSDDSYSDDSYSDDSEAADVTGNRNSSVLRHALLNDIVSELDGTKARIPGFVVPVEFSEEKAVTEFFLVPYFGACFHMPPPPPNQTIYVRSSEAIKYESIYDPVWIMGVIKTQQTGNDIATAAYSFDLHRITPYVE